jgi:hypothetical protein
VQQSQALKVHKALKAPRDCLGLPVKRVPKGQLVRPDLMA